MTPTIVPELPIMAPTRSYEVTPSARSISVFAHSAEGSDPMAARPPHPPFGRAALVNPHDPGAAGSSDATDPEEADVSILRTEVPFGPFLALAAGIFTLFQPQLTHWYLGAP